MPLDRAQFTKARDEWIRPSFDITGLRFLRDKAARERDVRELYRGRAPYELLQNADDVGARRAVFVLSPEGLGFGHDGKWFSVANFKSLSDGWSDKDPNQCIGHKGLGFRSVLDITPAPHVARVSDGEFFGFKFTWALNNGHIQECLRRNALLGDEYRRWIRNGQSACPVMAIPGEAKRINLGGGSAIFDGFCRGTFGGPATTFFWFPSRDPDADRQTIEDLGVVPLVSDAFGRKRLTEFVDREVSVLVPFLSNLEQIALYADGELLAEVRATGNRKNESGDEIRVNVGAGSKKSQATFFQMHGSAAIPPQIKIHPETPRAVRQMDKVNFRLSVRIVDGQPTFDPSAKFHVYFPTEEPTGFGFTVHADFFVKPDRTRLMEGEYNNWLFGVCATRQGNEFLSQLLKRYSAKACFESLRPESQISHQSARGFQILAGTALRSRKASFIPSRSGMLDRHAVALPSVVDQDGFWDKNFWSSLPRVLEKKAFLDPKADSDRARIFFAFAGIAPLSEGVILDLIEDRAKVKPSASWWYDVYTYLSAAQFSAHWGHEKVAGRFLIPDQDLNVVAVPRGPSPVLCLPPTDDASTPPVPPCFQPSFMFVNSEVSKSLHEGSDRVRGWLLTVCRMVQFEATELLPRAIAATVNTFYDGRFRFNCHSLGQLWQFLQKIIALSRGIKSEQFWLSIGRLPLPVTLEMEVDGHLRLIDLTPAFLCYWPDGDEEASECIYGVPEFRRLASTFIAYLKKEFAGNEIEWRSLMRSSGVSGAPKRLRYVRPIGAGKEMPLGPNIDTDSISGGFSGDRQRDENLVVLRNLSGSSIWRTYISALPVSDRHGTTLQEVVVIDRLETCVSVAEQKWRNGESDWRRRLWSLINTLPVDAAISLPDDHGFRRQAGGGGSNFTMRGYLKFQLARLRWAPSSLGPISPSGGFLRSASRRFVSRGTGDDELGDMIVPYVVTEQIEQYQRLMRLGVEPLEEGAASPIAMVRFLEIVGTRLSEPWAREAILSVRGRWRLVRGAIQECYRVLNQATTPLIFPIQMQFAAKVGGQIEFIARPLLFVEPGSVLERAFGRDLNFLDADRVYQALFDKLGIYRLLPRESVDEELSGSERAAPSSKLRDAIVNDIAPYLLSIVIAKSEEKGHRELVLRRLKERFDVYCVDRLTVKYRLRDGIRQGRLERTVDLPRFYMHRRTVEVGPALREMHFSLYGVASDDASIWDLDGDALGEALTPVFVDRPGDELAALFPRVVSRYQIVKGDASQMEEFLLGSLGISKESQGLAKDDISGKAETGPAIGPPPPLAQIMRVTTTEEAKATNNTDRLEEHGRDTGNSLENLIDGFRKKEDRSDGGAGTRTPAGRANSGRPTREQEARGRKGEEEFLRRVQLPGGWMGLAFERDCRALDTGYDFLCKHADREVMIEIKTFAPEGRVIVTARELKAAAQHTTDYYLIGFTDKGPESRWDSWILIDPLPHLLEVGKFDVDVKLQANANQVFNLSGDLKPALNVTSIAADELPNA